MTNYLGMEIRLAVKMERDCAWWGQQRCCCGPKLDPWGRGKDGVWGETDHRHRGNAYYFERRWGKCGVPL